MAKHILKVASIPQRAPGTWTSYRLPALLPCPSPAIEVVMAPGET